MRGFLRRQLGLCALALACPTLAWADTCTVTNTLDTGTGSLRDAFDCANADPGFTFIDFAIPGAGPHAISVGADLPALSAPVHLDGSSQAGFGVHDVVIQGSGTGIGVVLLGSGSVANGLDVRDFGTGIVVPAYANVDIADNRLYGHTNYGIQIVSSYGSAVTGNVVTSCGTAGISVVGGSTSTSVFDNTLDINGIGIEIAGGPQQTSVVMNQVTNSAGDGISVVSNVDHTLIADNTVGIDLATMTPGPNGGDGVSVIGGSDHADVRNNIIVFNSGTGVSVYGGASSYAVLTGNYIGTDGTNDYGNGGDGVFLGAGGGGHVVGDNPFQPNVIGFNGGDGIQAQIGTDHNTWSANRLAHNAGKAINLNPAYIGGVSANDDQLSPRITGVQDLGGGVRLITIVANADDVRVEVFRSNTDGTHALEYLGDATNTSGTAWQFTTDPMLSSEFAAVSTDADDNSSELGRLEEHDLTVTNTDDGGLGSLRYAIEFANAHEGHQVIHFDIPGTGPHVISPGTYALPWIEDPTHVQGCVGEQIVIDGGDTHAVGLTAHGAEASLTEFSCLEVRNFINSGLVNQAGAEASFDQIYSHDNGAGITTTASVGYVEQSVLSDNVQSGYVIHNSTGSSIRRSETSGNAEGINLNQSNEAVIEKTDIVDNVNHGLVTVFVEDLHILDNRVSGNGRHGLSINRLGGTDNLIRGNVVGLDVTQTVAQPNGTQSTTFDYHGIAIDFSTGNIAVGGPDVGDGNVVAGNTVDGISLSRVSGLDIDGNWIGVTPAGRVIGNGRHGLTVGAVSSGNQIGLQAPNVIGGNAEVGLAMINGAGALDLVVSNFIGTDPAGSDIDWGNGSHGILVNGNTHTIGGAPSEANTIGHNGGDGVYLAGSFGDGVVEGNWIGTDASGQDLGNAGNGVSTTVAGLVLANTIANNGGAGIAALDIYGHYSENVIIDNAGLAIDLDLGGLDANAAMPAPVIASGTPGSGLLLDGTTDADGDLIEVFLLGTTAQDALLFVGATASIGTDWSLTIPVGAAYAPGAGNAYVATASGRPGPLGHLNTSELSGLYLDAGGTVCTLDLPDEVHVCPGDSAYLTPRLRCGEQCQDPDPPPFDCVTGCSGYLSGATSTTLGGSGVACVAEGDSFTGHLTLRDDVELRVCGEAVLPSLNVQGRAEIHNRGFLQMNWSHVLRNTTWRNYGTMVSSGGLDVQGELYNHGLLDMRTLQVQYSGRVFNRGRMDSREQWVSGLVRNEGINRSNHLTTQSGGNYINSCSSNHFTVATDGGMQSDGGYLSTQDFTVRNNRIFMAGGRIDATRHLQVYRDIVGQSGTCSRVQTPDLRINHGVNVGGPIDFCGDPSPDNHGTMGPDVTFDCSCDVADPLNGAWTWDNGGLLDDDTSQFVTASVTAPTTFTVNVDDGSGVIASDQVTVVPTCP